MKRNISFLSLKNKKILITGAAGGLGLPLTKNLVELGAKVYMVDIKEIESERNLKKLLSSYPRKISYHNCDITNDKEIDNLYKEIKKAGGLNVLINNASYTGSSKLEGWNTDFQYQKKEGWQKSFELNLFSVFNLVQKFSPDLKKTKQGNIINIGSIYGSSAPDWKIYKNTSIFNPAAYGASKAGLINFTKWLAVTLSPEIRVNSVSPGGIKRNQPLKFIKRYESKTPLGRMAKEEDISGVIAFLASDLSVYMTGQDIRVDGGFGLK